MGLLALLALHICHGMTKIKSDRGQKIKHPTEPNLIKM